MGERGRPRHPDILTPREWEVLALLREGCTNEEIAARLGVALSTARFHVAEILGKLGVSSRAEAARWRPDGGRPPRRSFLLAPLALLRRTATPGTGARIAAGGLLAVVLAGMALLVWGVTVTGGSGSARRTVASRPAATGTAVAGEPGRGEIATEAGVVPWYTVRVSGGDLPHPVTVPFVDYLLATSMLHLPDDRTDAKAPSASVVRYRLDYVRADDGVTPVGSPGSFAMPDGAAPVIQGLSIGALGSGAQPWQRPSQGMTDVIAEYITLGRHGNVGERPNPFAGLLSGAIKGGTPHPVTVGGRTLAAGDTAELLAQLAAIEPVRFGVRAHGVGQRALKAVTIEAQLFPWSNLAGTVSVSYIPPGPLAPYGLLTNTLEAGTWEYSAIVDPPEYAQDAYSVPKGFDAVMSRLGYVGGPAVPNVDTRIMPLLDADQTMRITSVTLSDGVQTVDVPGADPLAVVCSAGLDMCGTEGAPAPTGETPLTLTISRRGVDPWPEFQKPAEYAYYAPTAAHSRGILVGTQPGLLWNASLGVGDGPFYASAAADETLRSAAQELRHGTPVTAAPP